MDLKVNSLESQTWLLLAHLQQVYKKPAKHGRNEFPELLDLSGPSNLADIIENLDTTTCLETIESIEELNDVIRGVENEDGFGKDIERTIGETVIRKLFTYLNKFATTYEGEPAYTDGLDR